MSTAPDDGPAFEWAVIGDVLVIRDLDQGATVTNFPREVLSEIGRMLNGAFPASVIYRDTELFYDGMEVEAGEFRRYYPIRTQDLDQALAFVRMKQSRP